MSIRPANRLAQTQRLALNTGLALSLRVLRHDRDGLTAYLEEQAETNPSLRLQKPERAPQEWLPRWTSAFAAAPLAPDIDVPAAQPGLLQHVSGQITLLFPPGKPREAAFVMMGALDPSGWLGRPLERLAPEAGLTLPEAEAVLARLQQMEPTGLFARSLRECLELQAREAEALDAPMAVILSHLDLLAAGDLGRLARLADVPEAEITRRLRRIRAFNPKPGSGFALGAAPIREPDLIVTRGPHGWKVALNRSALPEIEIAPRKPAPSDPASKAKAEAQLAEARALKQAVAGRNASLLRIGTEILRQQEAVLDHGLTALAPMTMASVAAVLSMHPSTISRAIAGVSAESPQGVFWLRTLFTTNLSRRGAAPGTDLTALPAHSDVSAGAIRAQIAQLVAKEDPAHPLSDQAIADRLTSPEAPLARRTVAKYRGLLRIPPTHARRVVQSKQPERP
jgi:RNA polymerase sigma-54 factor